MFQKLNSFQICLYSNIISRKLILNIRNGSKDSIGLYITCIMYIQWQTLLCIIMKLETIVQQWGNLKKLQLFSYKEQFSFHLVLVIILPKISPPLGMMIRLGDPYSFNSWIDQWSLSLNLNICRLVERKRETVVVYSFHCRCLDSTLEQFLLMRFTKAAWLMSWLISHWGSPFCHFDGQNI